MESMLTPEIKERIKHWISSQQKTLDGIIAKSGDEFYQTHKDNDNFVYDTSRCSKELWLLGQDDEDLCYDRPSIGFCYSLWHHGNRVSALLSSFEELIFRSLTDKRIDVYDLGAGTGAVQWAIAIAYCGLRELGLTPPMLKIINVDSSPFMLEYNQAFLWQNFTSAYPTAKEIETIFCLNNWTNQLDLYHSNNWVCASYVFDHTENKETLAQEFAKLVDKLKPSNVFLFTSSQTPQLTYVAEVVNAVKAQGYSEARLASKRFTYSGDLEQVNEFRSNAQALADHGFSGQVSWDRSYFYGKLLERTQITLPLAVAEVKIYQAPEIIRAKVRLTDQQERASIPTDNPTMIVGPAGCGKSVVLTERVRKIVEAPDKRYNPELRILVTTFNKKLVGVLGDWLEDILDKTMYTRKHYTNTYYGRTTTHDHCHFTFKGSTHPNIQVLHFDVLPTIIGNVSVKAPKPDGSIEYATFHRNVMTEVVDQYFSVKNIKKEDHPKIADTDFLLDEFERIFYGLQIKKSVDYMWVVRTGRGNNPTLQYNRLRRKIVYDCVHAYLRRLRELGMENFYIRRSKLLKKINDGKLPALFTHVLVDELQDCTRTDHQIFMGLLQNPNNILFTGDLAQSIQLGAAHHVPVGDEMKRFKNIKLEGSFRLPFRISQCLKPLSEKINKCYGSREGVEADIIIPYRGAQPGARPVVVYAKDVDLMAKKIADVINLYKIFGITTISLFERDNELREKIADTDHTLSTEIILKAKGLEYPCVIWSSRILADTKLEQEEFAYTIFTRTSGVLIVAAFGEIDSRLKEIIKIFIQERSIYWDAETSDYIQTQGRGRYYRG